MKEPRYGTPAQRLVSALRSGLGAGIGAFLAALLIGFDPQNPVGGALTAGAVVAIGIAIIQFGIWTYRAGKEERQ